MIFKDISKLVEEAGSRYGLIISVTKRARDITEEGEALISGDTKKSVSLATDEFMLDKIKVKTPEIRQ